MLSALATLTPFSDFNQSPRNMYQCQVGGACMLLLPWYHSSCQVLSTKHRLYCTFTWCKIASNLAQKANLGLQWPLKQMARLSHILVFMIDQWWPVILGKGSLHTLAILVLILLHNHTKLPTIWYPSCCIVLHLDYHMTDGQADYGYSCAVVPIQDGLQDVSTSDTASSDRPNFNIRLLWHWRLSTGHQCHCGCDLLHCELVYLIHLLCRLLVAFSQGHF